MSPGIRLASLLTFSTLTFAGFVENEEVISVKSMRSIIELVSLAIPFLMKIDSFSFMSGIFGTLTFLTASLSLTTLMSGAPSGGL
jgi:hypothetical protein